jgi:NhaP-type Na+/H+ or K+/H+ antiporter
MPRVARALNTLWRGKRDLFDFSSYHMLLAAFGLAILLAYWLPRLFSGREPAAAALLIGLGLLIFGWLPGMPDALSPLARPLPWEILSELCVIVGLFGVGLRIDRIKDFRRWWPTVRLLAIAMPLTILAVSMFGWWIGAMTLGGGLLLGAVLSPTDPVLAGDLQVGKPNEGRENLVRRTLTAEAGLNDGLAFPFVYLGMAVASAGAFSLDILGEWLWRDVAYRIAIGAGCGLVIGRLLAFLLFQFPRENALAKTEGGVFAMAGVFLTYGATELIEGYGFIAVFVAGVTLRRTETESGFHTRLHSFAENIEHALTAVLLIALGAALPALLSALTPEGIVIAVALIVLVRPLIGWVSLVGSQIKGRQRFVVAVYGVRGVGSIYYLSYAGSHMKLDNEAELWAITALAITISTILHGFSAAFAVEKVSPSEGGKETDHD